MSVMTDANWRAKYQSVLKSKRWKQLKWRLLGERKGCERCGAVHNLELHHKTYERIGRERDADVELVCSGCHKVADKERAIDRRLHAEECLYEARVNGFARAKYGEDYEYMDREDLEDEFDRWAEDKECDD